MLLKTLFVHHKTSLGNCNPPEMSYHTHYTPGNMVSSGDQPCVSLCNFGIILHPFLFFPLQTSQLPRPLPLTFYSLLLTKTLSSLSPEHFVTFVGRKLYNTRKASSSFCFTALQAPFVHPPTLLYASPHFIISIVVFSWWIEGPSVLICR